MSRFYTRTGDDGTTGILGKGRVKKSDLRMEVLGTLDELSAVLGMARSMLSKSSPHQDVLISIQRRLYEMMSEVAASQDNAEKYRRIESAAVTGLEDLIDEYSNRVDVPQGFVLPGETPSSAATALARTIARRAERRITELIDRGDVHNCHLIGYLNRLSSFLFVLEIQLTQESESGKPRLARELTQ